VPKELIFRHAAFYLGRRAAVIAANERPNSGLIYQACGTPIRDYLT
jgi:hypothetical protein